MSRSIHDTRRFLFEALHDDYADPELQDELIRTARRNLRQQRSIKTHVRQTRRQGAAAIPPLDADRLPIVSAEAGPSVYHPATEDDLRAVMRRLPPGSLDGLQAIELSTGSDGRGVLLSSYVKESRTIRLFAPLPEEARGELLIVHKLRTLAALLREGARHFDTLFRAAGSRWRTDDPTKHASYAARWESAQAHAQVIPYLQERYAAECAALSRWMTQHGGVALPLALLLDRSARREAAAWRALHALRKAVAAEAAPVSTRVDFARALHHAGHHDFAMASVARVLAEDPAQPQAWSVRACVASCRGEFELAAFICRGVLEQSPRCAEVWEVLARTLFAQRRWSELADCAARGIEELEDRETCYLLLSHRAQAWLALGRFDALAADIAALRAWGTDRGERAAAVLSALLLCRQGAFADAFAEANRLLARPELAGAAAELALVRFESAQHLGRSRTAGGLTDRQLTRLRAAGYEIWIDRLVAEYGLSSIRRRSRAD
jgi:tetratricopeptide (TPR) repeat protein